MLQPLLRSLSRQLGLSALSLKVVFALAISLIFSVSIISCSNQSITSQEVVTDNANAQSETTAQGNPSTGGTLDNILSAGVVKIAVPQDSPPFGSVGTDGKPQGYDVEVGKLISEALEVNLDLIPVTSTNRIPYLETGRADIVISSLGATPERARSIYFSSMPYAPFFSGIYGSASVDVSSYKDLAGYTVGVTQGSLEDLEVAEKAPESVTIKRFEDNSLTISALLSKQVDLIATGNTIAGKVMKSNPKEGIENKFVMKNSPCYIGVRRGDLDMLQWINVFIRHKRFSGEFDALSQEWFGESLESLPAF
ncbi:MAG: transporter substrate-binding domain-containing protein [Cyanobacteria bacterium]|jgi:polar amino acid transport system substrate-binding protein|nr:transporter substrate-binding domain-containing protein [Cyanobacteria bacterium GSL.Bin1]